MERPEQPVDPSTPEPPEKILYCHCAWARVIPEKVKNEVLRQLAASGASFEAVPDLCELSARRDPALAALAEAGSIRIAACFPRAVRWLFAAAGAPLGEQGVRVHNMREESPEDVVAALLEGRADAPARSGSGGESR